MIFDTMTVTAPPLVVVGAYMLEPENLDALILELIKEKMDNARDEMLAAIKAHSADPEAHPHAHDMEVGAAVEEHLAAAAAEIEAAIEAEDKQPETEAEKETILPPPEPETQTPPREEIEPKREHPLHRRVG